MLKIKKVENGRNGINEKMFFDTEDGEIEIDTASALEIAYTLFDKYNMPYEILDELNEKVEG